jgi:predicted nucleotidyltransferase
MVDLLTEEQLKTEIVRIVRNYIKGSANIYLFGSRADGNFKQTSDYDISIDTGERVPGDMMQNIREEFDGLQTMQKIDFSDFNTLNSEFQDKIESKGILLSHK